MFVVGGGKGSVFHPFDFIVFLFRVPGPISSEEKKKNRNKRDESSSSSLYPPWLFILAINSTSQHFPFNFFRGPPSKLGASIYNPSPTNPPQLQSVSNWSPQFQEDHRHHPIRGTFGGGAVCPSPPGSRAARSGTS